MKGHLSWLCRPPPLFLSLSLSLSSLSLSSLSLSFSTLLFIFCCSYISFFPMQIRTSALLYYTSLFCLDIKPRGFIPHPSLIPIPPSLLSMSSIGHMAFEFPAIFWRRRPNKMTEWGRQDWTREQVNYCKRNDCCMLVSLLYVAPHPIVIAYMLTCFLFCLSHNSREDCIQDM